MARTKISAPRSLSKKTALGAGWTRNACASRKVRATVLPEPVGPVTRKWPMSRRWKLNQYGVWLVVSRMVIGVPQWVPSVWPPAKLCIEERPA